MEPVARGLFLSTETILKILTKALLNNSLSPFKILDKYSIKLIYDHYTLERDQREVLYRNPSIIIYEPYMAYLDDYEAVKSLLDERVTRIPADYTGTFWFLLEVISERLKNNKSISIASVLADYYSIGYVTDILKDDKEVCLASSIARRNLNKKY
jgi:hypothetical protein